MRLWQRSTPLKAGRPLAGSTNAAYILSSAVICIIYIVLI
jgi:hypothetical protein